MSLIAAAHWEALLQLPVALRAEAAGRRFSGGPFFAALTVVPWKFPQARGEGAEAVFGVVEQHWNPSAVLAAGARFRVHQPTALPTLRRLPPYHELERDDDARFA
ncbi:UNVERIFIED_ORG: hypothetical protein M2348_003777 [Sphingomonas sp. R1F5B]